VSHGSAAQLAAAAYIAFPRRAVVAVVELVPDVAEIFVIYDPAAYARAYEAADLLAVLAEDARCSGVEVRVRIEPARPRQDGVDVWGED
jgi:hypothetical protein